MRVTSDCVHTVIKGEGLGGDLKRARVFTCHPSQPARPSIWAKFLQPASSGHSMNNTLYHCHMDLIFRPEFTERLSHFIFFHKLPESKVVCKLNEIFHISVVMPDI